MAASKATRLSKRRPRLESYLGFCLFVTFCAVYSQRSITVIATNSLGICGLWIRNLWIQKPVDVESPWHVRASGPPSGHKEHRNLQDAPQFQHVIGSLSNLRCVVLINHTNTEMSDFMQNYHA